MELEELTAVLKRNGITSDGWFKSVDDLLAEINAGESTIDNKGVRHLSVVNCEITDEDGYRLLEAEQHFKDGRKKSRMIKVSGKVQKDESPLNAMRRELREEIGLLAGSYVLEYIGTSVRENNNSGSYYGNLPSCAIRHHFALKMPKALWKHEYVEIAEDKNAYFRWFEPSE